MYRPRALSSSESLNSQSVSEVESSEHDSQADDDIVVLPNSVYKSDTVGSSGMCTGVLFLSDYCNSSSTDLSSSPSEKPSQPVLTKYPLKVQGSRQHCFSKDWYQIYPWIEYSVQQDAIYCQPCHFFGTCVGSNFIQHGFSNWKKATGKTEALLKHQKSLSHRSAMVAFQQLQLATEHNASIADQVNSQHRQIVAGNRHYIKTIASIILLCAKCKLALRGHDESPTSSDPGNFLSILEVICAHDDIVKEHYEAGSRNMKYTSPDIQNDLITIMGEMVKRRISREVNEAEMYSIMVDETKDVGKVEQISISVRYVKNNEVYERFLTYVHAEALNAEALSKHILGTLRDYDISIDNCVGQCYDGASVMSGQSKGVQTRIRTEAPKALYIHCTAHKLNLALVDTVKHIQTAGDFFALLESVYIFMSSSKAHEIFITQQKKLNPNKPPQELKRLSDTRWSCRHSSFSAVKATFSSIVGTLVTIVGGKDQDKSVSAKGILFKYVK